jgi:hypothetical protein
MIASNNTFKTYAFANPMIGNRKFAEEYQFRFAETNTSFSIINPADMVPNMPVHYQEEGNLLSLDRLKNALNGTEALDLGQIGKDFVLRKFELGLINYIRSSNELIEKLVSSQYTNIVMPEYTRDVNYFQVGVIKELKAFPYPKIKLEKKELSKQQHEVLKKDASAVFYKEEPNFFQHKPYNYYVEILKEYFSKEYRELELLYLPENL